MARWALTGGIGSGKSTVGAMFVASGLPVVDADRIYHALIEPSPGGQPSPLSQEVGHAFADVLLTDGRLDRKRLGELVFADAKARAKLEAITHPAVRAGAEAACAALEAQGVQTLLYDVPLLFERDLQRQFAGVVLVWVPRALQLQRLMARDNIGPEAASARLRAQWPLDDKRALSQHVIDNSGTQATTRVQVERVMKALQAHQRPV